MKSHILSERSFLTNFAMQTFFLIFLFMNNIFAQIVIKERVEIDPQKQLKGGNQVFSFPDTLNDDSDHKSISDSPQYQPESLQSTFPLPEGGRVTVEILYSEAAENSQIDLQLRQSNQETLIEFANHNIGFTWVSPDYFANNNEQEIQCHFAITELIDKYMKQINFVFKTKIPDLPCHICN